MDSRVPVSPEDVLLLVTAKTVVLHPDGRWGAAVLHQAENRIEYRTWLHWVDLENSGASSAAPRPAASAFQWSPRGDRYALVRGLQGGWQIEVGRWDGPDSVGSPEGLISVAAQPQWLSWDATGETLCFAARVVSEQWGRRLALRRSGYRLIQGAVPYWTEATGYQDGRFYQVFLVTRDSAGWKAAQLTSELYDHITPVIHPLADRVAYARPSSGLDRHYGNQCVAVRETSASEEQILAEPGGPCRSLAWSPSGDRIAWLSHDGHMGADEATDLRLWLAEGNRAWEVDPGIGRSLEDVVIDDCTQTSGGAQPIIWHPDGDRVFVLATDGAKTGLYEIPVTREGRARLVLGGPRRVFAAAVSARAMLAAVAAPEDPCRLVGVLDEGEQILLEPNQHWLKERRLAAPAPFAFAGANGDFIEGWLFAPIDASVRGAPCVLEVNRGRFGLTFYMEAQILTGRGYAVIMVNPHGSYGYGEQFKTSTHYSPATLEIEDFIRTVDVAVERGVDPRRVGVCGTSFGGFAVNWLISHYPFRFAAAVAQASYCNRHSLWGTSSIGPSRWDRPGPPWAEAEFLLTRSPLSCAPQVRVPVLLIHGSRDTICPLEQAAQWYTALTVLGRDPVWLILDDEGHDLARSARPESRILRLTMIANWFDRHLQPSGLAPAKHT